MEWEVKQWLSSNAPQHSAMIVTKEQQEALVDAYVKQRHNQDECIGFIDGINAALWLVNQILEREKNDQNKTNNERSLDGLRNR